jgi:hypothetical protein
VCVGRRLRDGRHETYARDDAADQRGLQTLRLRAEFTCAHLGANDRMTTADKRKQVPGPDLAPTREQLRAFAARRWDLVADEKISFVVARYQARGVDASRGAAQAMSQRWARLHPAGPSREARLQDFEHHVAMKKKLDLVAHAIGRR